MIRESSSYSKNMSVLLDIKASVSNSNSTKKQSTSWCNQQQENSVRYIYYYIHSAL